MSVWQKLSTLLDLKCEHPEFVPATLVLYLRLQRWKMKTVNVSNYMNASNLRLSSGESAALTQLFFTGIQA